MKCLLRFFFSLFVLVGLGCSNKGMEESIPSEQYAQIVETRSGQDLLQDLYIACDGDIELMSRILECPPSSVKRIRSGETMATEKFEERLRYVYLYYIDSDKDLEELRATLDPAYTWADVLLSWFFSHWTFWVLTIPFAIIMLIPLIGILGKVVLLIEFVVYIVALLASWLIPALSTVDNYTEIINPLYEQLL